MNKKILLFLICVFTSSIIHHPSAMCDTSAMSDTFTEIYEKLDGVNWGGKDINVAIESLEKIHPNAHIAATDERVVLVWRDSIVGNYPRPAPRDWRGFGDITTALVGKLREMDPVLAAQSENQMYETAVDALVRGIDENGRYVYGAVSDDKILTSVGLEGGLDRRGNFRIAGVYKDSPADNAGIKSGDLITAINGERVGRDVYDVMSGFNSGTLKLALLTPTGDKNVVLRRASIVLADADIIARSQSAERRY